MQRAKQEKQREQGSVTTAPIRSGSSGSARGTGAPAGIPSAASSEFEQLRQWVEREKRALRESSARAADKRMDGWMLRLTKRDTGSTIDMYIQSVQFGRDGMELPFNSKSALRSVKALGEALDSKGASAASAASSTSATATAARTANATDVGASAAASTAAANGRPSDASLPSPEGEGEWEPLDGETREWGEEIVGRRIVALFANEKFPDEAKEWYGEIVKYREKEKKAGVETYIERKHYIKVNLLSWNPFVVLSYLPCLASRSSTSCTLPNRCRCPLSVLFASRSPFCSRHLLYLSMAHALLAPRNAVDKDKRSD